MKISRVCELCKAEAAVYCSSDFAFLCCSCDTKVHGANFLVACHVRHNICYKCKAFTGGVCFSGIVYKPINNICASCLPEFRAGDSLSSSSACISSTESSSAKKGNLDVGVKSRATVVGVSSSSSTGAAAVFSKYSASVLSAGEVTSGMARKMDVERKMMIRSVGGARFSVESKVEGILIKWCRRLGLSSSSETSVVRRACHALKASVLCGDQMKLGNMPMHAWLAASLWLSLSSVFMMTIPREEEEERSAGSGVGLGMDYRQVMMKRLEEISGISVKLILAAKSKLILKMMMMRKRKQLRLHHPPKQQHMEEGWAEC